MQACSILALQKLSCNSVIVLSAETQYIPKQEVHYQWDAYRPLVDRIPACTEQEGLCPRGMSARGVCLPGGVMPMGCLPLVPGLGVCIPPCNLGQTPPCGQTVHYVETALNETCRKEREYGYFLSLAYGNPRTKFVQIQKFFWNKKGEI